MTDNLKKNEPPHGGVKWELSIACGCGVKPETAMEATKHAAETGHALTVHGVIGVGSRKVRVV